MFQELRSDLCQGAAAIDDLTETRLPFGRGIAAGLRVRPALLNGRSPRMGRHYHAASRTIRDVVQGRIPSFQFKGVHQ